MSLLQRFSSWVQESTLIGLCGILDLHSLFLLGVNPILLDIEFIAAHFDICRGGQARLLEIEDVIPDAWQEVF